MEDFDPSFQEALAKGLKLALGDVRTAIPSKVSAVGRWQTELVYFCSWQQTDDIYLMPNWVQGHVLKGLGKEQLVVNYYER